MIIFDYIIIGGGFSGLFLKKLLANENINVLLLEGKLLGGQLNLYLNKNIYDIPGIKKISGKELLDSLLVNNHNIIENCLVNDITIDMVEGHHIKKIHCIYNNNHQEFLCKKIISAWGKGLVKPVIFNYPGSENLIEKNKIVFNLNHLDKTDKIVAVLGGGDSALDGVEYFNNHQIKTYLIHRRNILTAMEGKIIWAQKSPLNTIIFNGNITELKELDNKIMITCNNETIVVDKIFMFYGLVTEPHRLNQEKITVHRESLKPMNNSLIDYAIGDCSIFDNKRFLIHNYMAECYRLCHEILMNHN